jgi:hypothetical protein
MWEDRRAGVRCTAFGPPARDLTGVHEWLCLGTWVTRMPSLSLAYRMRPSGDTLMRSYMWVSVGEEGVGTGEGERRG